MNYLDDFSNTIYKTMCARFTAFRRMKRNRDALLLFFQHFY